MMNTKKNMQLSVAEFLFIAFSQFITLKIISYYLGVAQIGLWSIIASAIQMARIVDPGATAGSLKFIAVAAYQNDRKKIEDSISSSFFVTAVMYFIVMIPGFYFFPKILSAIIDQKNMPEAIALVPFVIVSFYMQNIYNSFSACINNVGFGYAKSVINIFGVVLQIVISILFVKKYGLIALSIAQIANNIITSIMCIVFLKVKLKLNYLGMFVPNFSHIKSVLSVGSKVQGTSIAWTLFELSIRFLMGKFGGLTMTGYYEVAYRISAQFRILCSYIISPLVPKFAQLHSVDVAESVSYYKKIYAYLAAFGIVSAICILAVSPIASIFMFKGFVFLFFLFSLMTGLGTFMLIVAIPSEQYVIALGHPNYNLIGTTSMFILNVLLSWILGRAYGAVGVASGCVLSILISSSLIIILNSTRIIKSSCFPNLSNAVSDAYRISMRLINRRAT